jgi:prepilin-type N-terminal cleavage/methylation domain-containing protein
MKNVLSRNAARGFSLIELLVVVGIMALLGTLSLPYCRGALEGQRQQQNLMRMGKILEQAQLSSQTCSTYVWVGIADIDASGAPLKDDGVSVIVVTVLRGLTGSSADLASAVQVPNATVAVLMPPQVFRNAACPPLSGGGSPILVTQINQKASGAPAVTASSGIFATSADSSGASSLGISFTQNWKGKPIRFNSVLQFNATGQPMVNTAASYWIELAMGPSMGATVANSSGLLLSGLTGKVTLIP